jgi:DNA mismatch repair protein MutS
MALDEATRRNLELFRPLRGTGRVGTLLWLLDECRTAMGSRRLREWIGAPLLDLQAIADRQDAVEAFVAAGREEAREALRPVADLERLCARVVQGTASPRDLAALRFSLEALPALGGACRAPALARRIPEDLAPDVAADIAAWLVDEPPALTGDGGYIRDGADEALDRVRGLALDARGAIARMEDALRAETGVASLKIRYNSVFGYYIEVTKANLHRVPGRWHRKQTIATGERFITPELKEYEEQVAGAESRRVAMEAEFLLSLRARVGAQVGRLQALARAVGELDVFAALAEVAARWRWTRPEVDRGDGLELRAARHPVVEAARREERFVPNDLALDENSRLIILTGPNMAGKSTLMRQAALAVVLAQVGSFVPAQRARVGLVDRLFVRVGASDDLAKGQSTFMVEMSETANILASATSRSLVLLDEIGRGTATYDGVAIAWAVAEDLHDRVRCRGVFATHYHELAALTESCMRVRNFHVAVSEHQERVVFLRKVRPGPASGSYGIQCARLAGLPRPVVQRAGELLKQLERRRPRPEATQLSLFGAPAEPVAPPPAAPLSDPIREAVAGIDPDVLTPREALDALYRLRRLLDE